MYMLGGQRCTSGRRLVELRTVNEMWDDGWSRHHTACSPAPHIFGMTSCRWAGRDDSPSSDPFFNWLLVLFHPSACVCTRNTGPLAACIRHEVSGHSLFCRRRSWRCSAGRERPVRSTNRRARRSAATLAPLAARDRTRRA